MNTQKEQEYFPPAKTCEQERAEEALFDRGFLVGALVGGFVSFVVTLVLVALIHG